MRNPVNQLRQILGESATGVGTVLYSVDGAVTIQDVGGGSIVVKGAAAPGSKVYYRDDSVTGPAPDLPTYSIDI